MERGPGGDGLLALALRLGADVPVCLAARPARMGGVGELLAPAPELPRFGIALVNPGVAVTTAAVFRERSGPFSAPAALPAGWPDAMAMARDLTALGNDLEPPAIALCPAIGEALAALAHAPGLPAGAHERLRGDLLRPVRRSGGRRRRRGIAAAPGLVGVGRGLLHGGRASNQQRRMGRRQVVRQRILIPSFAGSIPAAPASRSV